jgi:hypothetical protein
MAGECSERDAGASTAREPALHWRRTKGEDWSVLPLAYAFLAGVIAWTLGRRGEPFGPPAE